MLQPQQTILVIADDDHIRTIISTLFTSSGYPVIESVDGLRAVADARQHLPALMVLDLTHLDCWQVARELRAQPTLEHIPILVITSDAPHIAHRLARELECQALISNHFTLKMLEEVATALLHQDEPQRRQPNTAGISVLIKEHDTLGLAAHIPDPYGQPLCHLNLNLANWRIHTRSPTSLLICHHCLRAQAKQPTALNAERPDPPEHARSVGDSLEVDPPASMPHAAAPLESRKPAAHPFSAGTRIRTIRRLSDLPAGSIGIVKVVFGRDGLLGVLFPGNRVPRLIHRDQLEMLPPQDEKNG